MRLTSLRLIRYGNFNDECIPFEPIPGVLNLVHAPNGGGKSVLRSAFCDLLFGISGSTPMGFRYGYPGMRIMAEASTHDNRLIKFGRRKGHGNTLIDAIQSELDPAVVTRLLGHTDRVRLERLFALDTERLRQGEADLLASDGDLGQALASGAGEVRNLAAIRKSLQDRRDGLAPKKKVAGRPFYAGLDRYVEARKRKDQSLLKPDHWETLERNYRSAEESQAEHNCIAGSASADLARLERIRRVRPLVAAIDEANRWLEEHSHAPVLDPGLAERLSQSREQVIIFEDRAKQDREAADRTEEERAALIVDELLLAEADEIDRLAMDSTAARNARNKLPSITVQAAAEATAIASFLRELGRSLPVERAAEAVPPQMAINRARRLLQEYQTLKQNEQAGPAKIQERTRAREKAKEELLALQPLGDMSGIEALLREIRADGDPARQANDAQDTVSSARVALTTAMANVPGWNGDVDALAGIAPLPIETYERHAATMERAISEAAKHSLDLSAAEVERDTSNEALQRLIGPAPLPDEAGMRHCRMHRDQGWQLIYRRAFTAAPPTLDEETAFAGVMALPLAYERAVSDADTLADRRVDEATLIERAHAAQVTLGDAETKVQKLQALHEVSESERIKAEDLWARTCSIFPFDDSPTLPEVRSFLKARQHAIDARHILLTAEAAAASLSATHSAWAIRLATLLEHPEGPALPDLLVAADRKLSQGRQAEQARLTRQTHVERAEADLAEATNTHEWAVAALGTWRADWARAMTDLGRPVDEDPAVTDDVLQAFTDLGTTFKTHASLLDQITDMKRELEHFSRDTTALAARIAPDLASTDPFLAMMTLCQRANDVRRVASSHEERSRLAKDAATKSVVTQGQLDDRRRVLQAVLLLIGAETVDAAEARLALAAQRRLHAVNLTNAESRLLTEGDSYPLETLRREVAEVTTEDLQPMVGVAKQRLGAAQTAAQEEAASAARLRMEMQQVECGTAALDAAADQQAAVATMGRTLEEALVYHVAAELLEQAIASAAQDAEPEMLRRISVRFSSLTDGAYSRVLTETDDNLSRLSLVQRDFPDERQTIRDLSEGTRDQLYLALRLAAIEDYADAPLPFIGDDILQTFDDDRALAALRVLLEVSQTVQVILLTHHRHLLDLANALPEGSVHAYRLGAMEEVA